VSELFAPPGNDWQPVSRALARMRRTVLTSVVLLLAVGAVVVVLVVDLPLWVLAAALVVLLTAGAGGWWVIGRNARYWGYAERDEDLYVKHGALYRRLVAVPYGRMQYVDVQAGPLEQLFRIASVHLHTASPGTSARIPGLPAEEAARRARLRVFGSKPGAYGAGLQALIDEKGWTAKSELAESYVVWGAYAYGADAEGQPERERFEARLAGIEAVVQNQDNREHDLLDSDDYYQFEGGLAASVEALRGEAPRIFHNDHSRPERPVIRSLDEEIARVVRGRAANPKWIAGVMRHGYKGAFEIAATVDYLFAFAATTNAVKNHHFDQLYEAYLGNPAVRNFIADNNTPALAEIAARFREAVDRGLWAPRRNSAYRDLSALTMPARRETRVTP